MVRSDAPPLGRRGRTAAQLVGAVLVLAACSSDQPLPSGGIPEGFAADACLVRLHGRSERGSPPVDRGAYGELFPDGNATFRDGREWRYATDEELEGATTVVATALDRAGCDRAVLHGFSNGAAFAGKLVCSGETFDDRLVGVVVDDPVPDGGATGCEPASIPVAVYWTGALVEAEAGADCEEIGWTCDGRIVGIDAYARSLGVPVQPSIHDEHDAYLDAPELEAWLAAEAT